MVGPQHFRWELWTLLMSGLSLAVSSLACLLLAAPKLAPLKLPTLRLVSPSSPVPPFPDYQPGLQCLGLFGLALVGWLTAGGIEAWYAMRLQALLHPTMRELDLRQPHELVNLYRRYHIRALLSGLSFGSALLYAASLLTVPSHVSQLLNPYAQPPKDGLPRHTLV